MKKQYGKRTDYDVEKIGDGVYRIDEFGSANCYLVVGTKKALLIDTGIGTGDLLGAVKKITDLPLAVAATHGHPDHIGGMGQFPEIHLHKADQAFFFKAFNTRPVRKLLLAFSKIQNKGTRVAEFSTKDVNRRGIKTKIVSIDDTKVFELGGRNITVKNFPGHSPGSLVLFDDLSKIMFTGDNANPMLFMFLPKSTSLKDWQTSAKAIIKLMDEYTPYYGHDKGLLKKEWSERVLALSVEILEKNKKNKFFYGIKLFPKKFDENGTVFYRPDRLY